MGVLYIKKKMTVCDLFIRYYMGHILKKSLEYVEFVIFNNGYLRYCNHSCYRNLKTIFKNIFLSKECLYELEKMFDDTNLAHYNDKLWPSPDGDGCQELEIFVNNDHYLYSTKKLGSIIHIEKSSDPDGLTKFHFFVQDLKCFLISALSIQLKIYPY